MSLQGIVRRAAPVVAAGMVALGAVAGAGAAPKTADGPGIARRALSGDAAAGSDLEKAIEPLFDRKDLLALDDASGAREASRLLGLPETAVRWYVLPGAGGGLRVLTVDLGAAAAGPSGDSRSGYVAYGIVEAGSGSAARVSWYHDAGRKLAEQGGRAWHPVGIHALTSGGEGKVLAVEAAAEAGASEARGVLVLEQKGGEWTATRRLSAGGEARLIAVGAGGAVFLGAGAAPKGVLSGAPASTFRALVFYDRTAGGFAADPIAAAIPDVVTATETLLAVVRRGDKDGARRLCTSADVLDAMLYFSPGWKGGGRVVQATPTTLEIVYEEIERPTLRVTFTYQNRGGVLLLASVTGRAENDPKKS